MRIGMVCPYSFDVPGGVQSHVLQLAEVMHGRGHEVSVLAPSSPHVELPDYVVSGGKAVPIPYNGSVARLRFGPATHRMVKRWLADGDFDVLHLHEPNAPSLSMLALNIAEGPIVATFHTSTTKSLTLSVFEPILRPMHEKIVGRIAVSDLARRWQMEALGSDAVEIPNGVDVASFANAPLLDGYPRPGKSVLFLGRFDEPRKGMAVLLGALPDAGEAVSRHRDPDRRPRRRGRTARGRRETGRASALPWSGRRRREGVGDAQRRRVLRPAHRRGELRHRACRGHGGGYRCGGQRSRCVPPGSCRRQGRAAGAGRRRRGAGGGAGRGAGERRLAGALRGRRGRGRAPLRLVGRGPPDHAGLRDRRRIRDEGAGGGNGGQGTAREGQGRPGEVSDHLGRDHRAGRAGRCHSARGRVGVPDRQPAGPAARAL